MGKYRYYYRDTITDFLSKAPNEIIGSLTVSSVHHINEETTTAWLKEIDVMKNALSKFSGRGSVYFEYNIPRMGKRVDVIALIDNIVFILEFKAMNDEFSRESFIQVWDYALDLKNFQIGSKNRIIVPILVATKASSYKCRFELSPYKDQVYKPLLSNAGFLNKCITDTLSHLCVRPDFDSQRDLNWARSGYMPTPTIIEAAIALYNHHTVENITKHDADLRAVKKSIDGIIAYSKKKKKKSICFVTGVPGAGKTLIGLQTAINHFDSGMDEGAVYLSGNFPLVEVLQEALSRDYVKRDKERYLLEKQEGKNGKKPITKKWARSQVKSFIQMIHQYRDTYLEGIKVDKDTLVPLSSYFTSHQDKAYVPVEHITIFDEAQRAWTRDELARFLNDETKGKSNELKNFPYSEPEFLISCMNRHEDWGVIICLIGGGQEINKGEAGISEWIASINRRYQDWDVYISNKLIDEEYEEGILIDINDIIKRKHLTINPSLHLSVSMRSFRAEKVSTFVYQLLKLKSEEAAKTLKDIPKYPIVLTRSLDKAKAWLRSKTRGSERCGLLASSKAERLKAISINVRYQPDFVQWFLAEENDIRSSNCLEDTLTEFKVQGLELDWTCVVWDADMRLNKDHTKWEHWQLRGGEKWTRINKSINQKYQINAYRVLLTRARQGMIIVVPYGDNRMPPDDTRKPEWYDDIYNYLKDIGIKELK